MSNYVEYADTVVKGHFSAGVRINIANAMREFEGKRVLVKISEPTRFSSSPQRRYYFGVIIPPILALFRDYGTVLTKDEMHHWLMENVGKWFKDVAAPDGTVKQIRRSYNDLERSKETETYHTLCRQWAAELGVQIAEPNEEEV